MQEILNISKIYNSFNDINISNDIKTINFLISDIELISVNKIDLQSLEKFLYASNSISLLMNKLYSYSYLNLYLNTKNNEAKMLINKINVLDQSFNTLNFKIGTKLSYEIINDFSKKSPYIFKHKYYLTNIIKQSCVESFNNDLELKYNEKASTKIVVNNNNYSINTTVYDLMFDKALNSISHQYLYERKVFFNENANFFSKTLVQIKKDSINLASKLGYDNPLEMSFSYSGFDTKCIEILMKSIEKNKNIFKSFLESSSNNYYEKKYSTKEIENIILNSFLKFHPDLYKFSKKMFKNNYMDFRFSKDKFAGNVHVKLLFLKESRIIGQPYNNIKGIFQIAHEIGHAFQCNYIMNSKTPLNSNISTPICEIISVFCELIVLDYLLDTISDVEYKKYVLYYIINYFIQTLLDVHSRFNFEYKVFELTKNNKNLSFKELNEIMLKSQLNVYSNSKYIDKYLWIYKPHFYSVSTPFYNYPYAFGLLYAIMLFKQYKNNSNYFYENFKSFCENSGCESIKELSKYFNIDVTNTNCYESSYNYIKEIIDLYFN